MKSVSLSKKKTSNKTKYSRQTLEKIDLSFYKINKALKKISKTKELNSNS